MDVTVPDLLAGEVLVRTEVSSISPGTELRCLAGLQPDSLEFPFVPGYSLVGIVEESDNKHSNLLGCRVFVPGCQKASINMQWGGHISYAVVPASSVVVVPECCGPKNASIAKLTAIALRGVRISNPRICDHIVIVGLGPIGLMSAKLFKLTGAKVLGVDTMESRVLHGSKCGLDTRVVRGSIADTVLAHFGDRADIVVDATGVPEVLAQSLLAAKDPAWGQSNFSGSKLVVQGSYPGSFTLPYQEAFRKELSLLFPRDTTPALLREAIALIAEKAVSVEDLISWYGAPGDAQKAYDLLMTDRSCMTASFDWT